MAKVIAKRVSNYELFYDLVFVLAISRLTSTLHHVADNPSAVVVFIVNSLLSVFGCSRLFISINLVSGIV